MRDKKDQLLSKAKLIEDASTKKDSRLLNIANSSSKMIDAMDDIDDYEEDDLA